MDPSLNRSTLYKLYCSQIYSVITLHLNAHHLLSTLKTSPGIPHLVNIYKILNENQEKCIKEKEIMVNQTDHQKNKLFMDIFKNG